MSDARVDQERRLDFAVAVLARVQIEHEVDERAREPRAGAAQHGEPRAGDLGGALEVDDAERRPEIPVRLRLEVERARLAVAPHFDVVRGALADRHAARAAGSGSVEQRLRRADARSSRAGCRAA